MRQHLRSWGQDHLLRGIIKNSSYLFSSNTIAAALSFVQGILATRLLGIDGYGLVSGTVIVFASNVNRLLSFRMSEVVVKFFGQALAEGRKERAGAVVKAAGLAEAAMSLIAYGVLLAITPLAATYLAKDGQTTPLFAIYGLTLLANVVYETSNGILQTTRRFDQLALINLVQSSLTAGLILLAYLSHGGVLDVLLAYLSGKTVAGLAVMIAAIRQLKQELGPGWWHTPLTSLKDWRTMARFAVGTNLNGTINLFVRDSETLLIAAFWSKTEVGYFRLAQGLINLVLMPVDPLIAPTYSEISRTIALHQWQTTRRLLKRVSIIAGAWTFVAGGGMVLFGPWLIPLLYKPQSAPAYPAFVLLLIGYGFASILQWNRSIWLSFGLAGFPVVITAIVGMLKTILTFSVVPRYGYLAEAAVLSGFFVLAIGIIAWRGLVELNRRSTSQVEEA